MRHVISLSKNIFFLQHVRMSNPEEIVREKPEIERIEKEIEIETMNIISSYYEN